MYRPATHTGQVRVRVRARVRVRVRVRARVRATVRVRVVDVQEVVAQVIFEIREV